MNDKADNFRTLRIESNGMIKLIISKLCMEVDIVTIKGTEFQIFREHKPLRSVSFDEIRDHKFSYVITFKDI